MEPPIFDAFSDNIRALKTQLTDKHGLTSFNNPQAAKFINYEGNLPFR
jgi:hypothetical protein